MCNRDQYWNEWVPSRAFHTKLGQSRKGCIPIFLVLKLFQVVRFNGFPSSLSRDKVKSTVVFEIHVDTWVYSKDDTMAHAHRLVVIS